MRKFFSLIAAVLFAGSMMATEVTVSKTVPELVTAYSWENGSVVTPFALDEVITVSTDATDPNTGKYYSGGQQVRLYQTGAAKLIISAAEGYSISSITLTYVSYNTGILLEAESGVAVDFENVQSATFTVGNSGTATNGQARITAFSVTYNGEGGGDQPGGDTTVVPVDTTEIPPVVVPTDTLTCADAAELALAGNTDERVIKGYVTSIAAVYNSQYNNISFWMADAADGGQVFEAFRVACAAEADAPVVGDLVWVKGNLKNYNGTPETNAGGTFGILAKAEVVPVDTIPVTPEDTTVVPVSEGNEVIFTNADFAGQGTANTGSEVTATKDGVTFTYSKGYSADESLRCYAHGALSITAETTIEKINFTTTGGKTGGLDAEVTVGATSYSVDDLASQARFTEIKVTLAGGDVPPVEPTEEYYLTGSIRGWAVTADDAYKFVLNTAAETEGEYMLQGITLAANDELKVIGLVGETVNWYPTATNLTVAADGTYDIYFRPDGQGGEGWHEGTLYLAEFVPQTAMSLTEFIAAAPTTEVTLKDLTVIFAAGKNTYVIDEDGVALVIYDAGQTYYDGTLTAGKVLSGQKATYTKYKNQDEIIPTNAVVATDGVAPVPTELSAKPTDANINRYISFKNVAATANNNKYFIYEDVQLYGATGALKPTAEGNYDIEGIYILYNESVPEIIVTGIAASTPTAINNVAVEDKAVKVIREGQLFIMKNGVLYNAQGAIVK